MKRSVFLLLVIFSFSAVFAQRRYQQPSEAERYISQGIMAQQWGDIERACQYYEQAAKADPKSSEAFYLWGSALCAWGMQIKEERLLKDCFDKFKTASKLDPDNAGIYNDWAYALMELGKMTNNTKKYMGEAESLLKKTEKLGEQMGAYNLACLYSLQGKKKEAMEWLNKMMTKKYENEMQNISRRKFDEDKDFDNIRQSDEFIEFLNKQFPNQLPDNFQAM